MTDFALVTLSLVCWIMVFLRIYTYPCEYRDEACAWSCGMRHGHAGEHGLWVKDEWADKFGPPMTTAGSNSVYSSPLLVPGLPAFADVDPCGYGLCPEPGRVPIVTWQGLISERYASHARALVCWPPTRMRDIEWPKR